MKNLYQGSVFTENRKAMGSWKMGDIKPPVEIKPLPPPPTTFREYLIRILGPGLILGMMGVGGFEAMHAPMIGAKGWISVSWLYIVATLFSLLIAREITRWTVVTGETIFQGFFRMKPRYFWPIAWMIVNPIGWVWPAWIIAAAAGMAILFGADYITWGAIGLLAVPVIYSLGKYVYRLTELFFKLVVIITVVLTVGAFLVLAPAYPHALAITAKGWFIDWFTIPAGMTIVLLMPYIVQPAGGTSNLWHSYWLREKGIGNAYYIGKVTGWRFKPEEIPPAGFTIDAKDIEEIRKVRKWLRLSTMEAFIMFCVLCSFFTFVYNFMAYAILYPEPPVGLAIPVAIAKMFGKIWPPLYGIALFSVAFGLFDTQFGMFDGIARVWADTAWFECPKFARRIPYRAWYFIFIYITTILGLVLLPVKMPYEMWLLVHVFLTFSMFIYIFQILWMNNKYLPKEVRPSKVVTLLLSIWALVQLSFTIMWISEVMGWWYPLGKPVK